MMKPLRFAMCYNPAKHEGRGQRTQQNVHVLHRHRR